MLVIHSIENTTFTYLSGMIFFALGIFLLKCADVFKPVYKKGIQHTSERTDASIRTGAGLNMYATKTLSELNLLKLAESENKHIDQKGQRCTR